MIGSKARSDYSASEDVMIVVTRAQAKKQFEEELIRREQEVLFRAQPSPVEGLGQSNKETSHTDTPQEGQIPLSLTQEQRRSLRRQMAVFLLKRGRVAPRHAIRTRKGVELKYYDPAYKL